jgi:hypothetical protein
MDFKGVPKTIERVEKRITPNRKMLIWLGISVAAVLFPIKLARDCRVI